MKRAFDRSSRQPSTTTTTTTATTTTSLATAHSNVDHTTAVSTPPVPTVRSVPDMVPATPSSASSKATTTTSRTRRSTIATTTPSTSKATSNTADVVVVRRSIARPWDTPTTTTTTQLSWNELFHLTTRLWERSRGVRLWHVALGVVACVDFVAAMVRRHSDTAGRDDTTSMTTEGWTRTALTTAGAAFLTRQSDLLGIVFSLLWFVDAVFVAAHSRRREAARVYERTRLCCRRTKDAQQQQQQQQSEQSLGRSRSTVSQPSHSVVSKKEDSLTSLNNVDDPCDSLDDDTNWWYGFRGAYYRAMAIQFLLLPVGFFIFCYNLIRHLTADSTQSPTDFVLKIVHHGNNNNDNYFDDSTPTLNDSSCETFSSHATVSLGFAVLRHILLTLADRTGTRIKLHGVAKLKAVGLRVALGALRHPIRFHRRYRKVTHAVRWVRYLGPMIGTSNKLKGNVGDLVKKLGQFREAQRAKAIRLKLWNRLTQVDLQEYCATLIQKTFRAHQARKYLFVLNVMTGQKEMTAVVKLQSAFRGSLARARIRLRTKWKRLDELKDKEQECRTRKNGTKMTVDERRRMYDLQEELETEARALINKKLLLRPNTTFAVTWKVLFVAAVFFEISILACKPLIARHKDPVTGQPLDLEAVLDKKLIPKPMSTWDMCKPKEPFKWSIQHPIRSIQRLVEIQKQSRREAPPEPPKPWICGETYGWIQRVYIAFADLIIHHFLIVVSVVCFLDVPIVFFTGEYNADSGALEPKPTFQRWILPGLVLQLLVNPKMQEVSQCVSKILDGLTHHGPVRIVRWTLALFYPIFLFVVRALRRFWYEHASSQNQRVLTRHVSPLLQAKARRRRTHPPERVTSEKAKSRASLQMFGTRR